MVVLPALTRTRDERAARRRIRRLAQIARREERAFARAVQAFLQGR